MEARHVQNGLVKPDDAGSKVDERRDVDLSDDGKPKQDQGEAEDEVPGPSPSAENDTD